MQAAPPAAPRAGRRHTGSDRAYGRRPAGARGFNVETLRNVEIPHCTETFRLNSMFYFRATKSFHVIRRSGAGNRAGTVARLPAAPRSSRLSPLRAVLCRIV